MVNSTYYDIVFYDTVGMPYTGSTPEHAGLGGSEFETILLAEALAARGRSVLVLNMTTRQVRERGVDYANHDAVLEPPVLSCKFLLIQRYSKIPQILAERILVVATDIPRHEYDHLHTLFDGGPDATLVTVSEWQRARFPAHWQSKTVPNMLPEYVYDLDRPINPRRFVYASAALKGLDATLAAWQELYDGGGMEGAELCMCTPGYDSVDVDDLASRGVRFLGSLPFHRVAEEIAASAGLFYVNAWTETFSIVAALTEALGRRVHILYTSDPGGLPHTVRSPLVTGDRAKFLADFRAALADPDNPRWHGAAHDYRVSSVMPQWLELFDAPTPDHVPAVVPNTVRDQVLYAEFRHELAQLTGVVDASPHWSARSEQLLVEAADHADARELLRWPALGDTNLSEFPVFLPWYRSLKNDAQWSSRWRKLTRESAAGSPKWFSLDAGTSPLLVQHVYNYAHYERSTGKSLKDLDCLIEFGGGFGSFARVLQNDGFSGIHIIYDLPPMGAVQRLYLRMLGIEVDSLEVVLAKERGVATASAADLAEIVEYLRRNRDQVNGLLGTWSFSETPLAVRDEFLSVVAPFCDRALIAYQPNFDGIDNTVYFSGISRLFRGNSFITEPVPDYTNNTFVIVWESAEDGMDTPGLHPKTATAIRGDGSRRAPIPHRDRCFPIRFGAVSEPVTARPAICLNMIVKNEAHIVAEVLDSVAPYISSWVIVDTGSTDGTQDLIRNHMARLGIPGELHERPWRNFGHNRTEALKLAQGHGDYIWVIDADDIVVGTPDFTQLSADIYHMHLGGASFTYWRKQLFRDGVRVRYEGVVHETAVGESDCVVGRLEGEYVIESRRLGSRSQDTQRYARDRDLLLAEVERNPEDARSVFYLAQSYFDLDDFVNARKWYERRVEMGGWDEEVYYSMVRLAESMARLDWPWLVVQDAYLKAWEFRPTRAEALHAIARRYREDQRYPPGHLFAQRAAQIPFPEKDLLFVGADVYAWRAIDEQAVCASQLGKHAEAFMLCRRLLALSDIPDDARQRIAGNRDFSVPTMLDAASSYPDALVQRLVAGPGEAEVVVSLVAGPDRETTEQAINSFLNCCLDVSLWVGRFLVVDAGLSAPDRALLRERYGFLEFVDCSPGDGPAAQLRAQIQGRFWLRLGHGWRFFAPENFITRLIAVLDAEPRVFQVGINFADAAKLTGVCAAEAAVRRAPHAGRYVLTDEVASGPAMFDTTRMDPADSTKNSDPDPITELGRRAAAAGLRTASLDEVLCIATVPLVQQPTAPARVTKKARRSKTPR